MMRRFSPLLVFLVTAAVYGHGALEFAETRLTDIRYKTVSRPATGRVVLVEIDERSLRAIDVWPWPRRHHAIALERLLAAGANLVAVDLDLSSHSNDVDDRLFATAARTAGQRLMLSAFRQTQRGPAGELVTYRTKPIRAFREAARLAVVNFYPEPDGLVRQATTREPWGLGSLPTLPAAISGTEAQMTDPYFIDFGIRPESVPRISFADVLSGRFDRSLVRGNTVVIGASAASLGDIVAVPVYAAVPGAMLQILAAESILQGRMLRRPGAFVVLSGVLVIATLLGWCLNRLSWRKGALSAGLAGGAIVGLSFVLQAWFPLSLDIAPWLLAVALSYVVSLITRIDDQSIKLLLQRLALRRSDTFIRRIFDNTFDGIITVDGQALIRSFNASAQRIFGQPAGEVMGKPLDILLESGITAPESPAPAKPALPDAGTYEVRGRHSSGAKPYLELAVTHMEHEDGSHAILLVRDVTTIKQRERDMARLTQKYAQVAAGVEATTTGVVLTDPNMADNPVVFVNPAYCRMTGHEPGEVIGKAFAVARCTEIDPDARRAIEEAVAGARSESAEVRYRRKDGSVFWVRIQVSPVRDDDGRLLFFVWVLNDISENKDHERNLVVARDEAIRANRMKSEFLAAMSHELRTPLNAIIGFSEMMEGQYLGPIGNARYLEYAHDIRESGAHLRDIIMDILDMAKIESGKFELIEEEISAVDVITACLRIVKPRADAGDLSLTAEVPENLPCFRADSRVFKQILLNLLSNAVKFTSAGGRIRLSVEASPDDGVTFAVSDTGIGMSATDMDVALQPFAQIDGELNRKYEGTGLGLPLAKSFIEQHGGTLEIRSDKGVGTVVTFTIPRERILTNMPADNAIANRATNY